MACLNSHLPLCIFAMMSVCVFAFRLVGRSVHSSFIFLPFFFFLSSYFLCQFFFFFFFPYHLFSPWTYISLPALDYLLFFFFVFVLCPLSLGSYLSLSVLIELFTHLGKYTKSPGNSVDFLLFLFLFSFFLLFDSGPILLYTQLCSCHIAFLFFSSLFSLWNATIYTNFSLWLSAVCLIFLDI